MGATVERLSVPRRYRAWCEQHQDGYQGGKAAAEKWAAAHNKTRHAAEEAAR